MNRPYAEKQMKTKIKHAQMLKNAGLGTYLDDRAPKLFLVADEHFKVTKK